MIYAILSTCIITFLFSFAPVTQVEPQKLEIITLDWSSKGDIAVGYNATEEIRIYNQEGIQIAESDWDMFVKTVAWNPDGSRLAYITDGEADNVWIWDIDNSTPELIPIDYGYARDITWNTDGSKLLIASQISIGPGAHNYLSIWDTITFEELTSMEISYSEFFIYSIDWNPVDENQLVTGAYAGRVYVWDIENKTDLVRLSVVDETCFWPHDPEPDIADYDLPACNTQDVAWIMNGNRLVATASQGIWLWDTATWEVKLLNGQNSFTAIAWSRDGQLAAMSFSTLVILEPSTGESLLTLESPNGLYDIAWSPDGTQLAYGGVSGELHIIDISLLETTPEPT